MFNKRFRRSQPFATAFFSMLAIIQIVLLCGNTYGQSISSDVVVGFGSTVSVQSHTYESSVGELAITTFSANDFSITQGFLQPINLKVPCADVVLSAFPNPVFSGISIYAEGCDVEIANIKTYDLMGKMVYEAKPVNNKINLSSIGVGVYLVRAYGVGNKVLGVVKILKSTI